VLVKNSKEIYILEVLSLASEAITLINKLRAILQEAITVLICPKQ
jgi:hypothetical protein